jgi:hypothetical protein
LFGLAGIQLKEPTMPTLLPSDIEIERIARGLIDRSLPKAAWTHAGHFAAALWLLRHRGEPAVTAAMPNWIRRYNEATGVANTETTGYHETITRASIRAAHSLLELHSDAVALHEVFESLMASELGRSDWLLRYWSRSRLFSAEARRRWLEPDLNSLPYGCTNTRA